MKFLIFLPCYNEEKTIASVLQKVPKELPSVDIIDILVVDDGSKDKSVEIAKAESIELAYKAVDKKVKQKVDKMWGGKENVKRIANKLAGQTVTLNTLPGKIKSVDPKVDAYGLATFIGLASGGGVSIKYHEKNYAFNIHYDVKEQRSGRSFGTGPTRGANDASDKQYLDDLEEYTRGDGEDLKDFYTAMFKSLLNCDSKDYVKVEPEGESVLTDFLAVYTAEQARNLMDGRVSPHWDAALLEVTLLAAFHAGQEKIKLFYKYPNRRRAQFVDTTMNQTPCEEPSKQKKAQLRDYWQFSKNINDPKNCKRSGINITKSEFRKLGQYITTYVAQNDARLLTSLKNSMALRGRVDNVFEALSSYLITDRLPERLDSDQVKDITKSWIGLLEKMRDEASEITKYIEEQEGSDEGGGTSDEDAGVTDVSDGFESVISEDEAIQKLN